MNILPPKVAAGRCHTSTPVGRAGVWLMGLCLPSLETCVSQVNHAKLYSGEGVSMGAMEINQSNNRETYKKQWINWANYLPKTSKRGKYKKLKFKDAIQTITLTIKEILDYYKISFLNLVIDLNMMMENIL